MSHLIYPIGIAEISHEEYDTGWINRSDWTNVHMGSDTTKNVDSDVAHNLNSKVADLDISIWFSSDGTDANAIDATSVNYSESAVLSWGYLIYQTGLNSFKVQTGVSGIIYYTDSGVATYLADWYYRIKVKKKQPTSRIIQNPNAAGVTLMFHVQDKKAYNVPGGTFTAGADRIRDLNNVVTNEISGALLGSNQISLPAGTYDVEWFAPGFDCGRHWSWLYDTTHTVILIRGSAMYANNSTDSLSSSQGMGRITLSEETALEIRHRCGVTSATTNGLGVETSVSGYDSIYTNVIVRRIY